MGARCTPRGPDARREMAFRPALAPAGRTWTSGDRRGRRVCTLLSFQRPPRPLRRGDSSDSTRPGETSPRRVKRTAEYSAGAGPLEGLPQSLRDDVDRDGALARAIVEVQQDDLLPGAQGQLSAGERDALRRPHERRPQVG